MVRTAKSPQYPESLGLHPRSNNHYVFQEPCTKCHNALQIHTNNDTTLRKISFSTKPHAKVFCMVATISLQTALSKHSRMPIATVVRLGLSTDELPKNHSQKKRC